MTEARLSERDLTRLSFLAASICVTPQLWTRLLLVVMGWRRFGTDVGDSPEFQDVVNGLWDAFAVSTTIAEATQKMIAQGGIRARAGLVFKNYVDLNFPGRELQL